MVKSAKPAGEKLADEIQRELESSGMNPGSIVASERDLRATHDTGRSVLRQAVRILESRGVVKMRRGQRGGLIVQQPGPEAAARTLAILIESELQSPSDIRELLRASDTQIFTRDLAGLAMADCLELRALAAHLDSIPSEMFGKIFGHRMLHDAIRRVIPDAALALSQWTCLECGIDLTPARPHAIGERTRSEFWTLSLQALEAMIAQDISRLFDIRLRQYRIMDDSVRDWPIDAIHADAVLPRRDYLDVSSPKSRADILTREILRDARALKWQEGARLGSAGDLLNRYGVSLLVLRQAVRVLEECSAVRMERGRHGGLFIAKPSRETAISRARRHLHAARLSVENARAFLVELLLTCLSMARRRASTASLDACRATIQQIRAPFFCDAAETHQLCSAIAALASNPALTIFIEVLEEFVLIDMSSKIPPRNKAPWPRLEEMHEALIVRDNSLARRALLQHVQDASAAARN